jgi:diaminohydroxyphosphoribosylaminopyrimidine deaminase/5-amino-6-(5-phosphoribosylamino)uracil reductase
MKYMERALELARESKGGVSPNPPVGAVVVRDGHVIGEGSTQPPDGSRAHAEVEALAQAGTAAQGATLYVTLEPCCHQGYTPPCTRALLQAGIAEVHIAIQDPNPQVDGKGAAELRSAGIRVFQGEAAVGAREVMEGYLKWITTGMPFVSAKYAMSLDGKIATASGESQWITGPYSRARVHRIRGEADAILVGVGTALADNPRLTVRDQKDMPLKRQPLRVVVDSQGRLSPDANIFKPPGGLCIVAMANPSKDHVKDLHRAGAEVIIHPSPDGRIDLSALLKDLGERQIANLLVEGGAEILASLLEYGLVDKIIAFIAPIFIGGRTALSPVGGRGVHKLMDAIHLERVTVEQTGEDTIVSGYTMSKV